MRARAVHRYHRYHRSTLSYIGEIQTLRDMSLAHVDDVWTFEDVTGRGAGRRTVCAVDPLDPLPSELDDTGELVTLNRLDLLYGRLAATLAVIRTAALVVIAVALIVIA